MIFGQTLNIEVPMGSSGKANVRENVIVCGGSARPARTMARRLDTTSSFISDQSHPSQHLTSSLSRGSLVGVRAFLEKNWSTMSDPLMEFQESLFIFNK